MSDTPRTEGEVEHPVNIALWLETGKHAPQPIEVVPADFARQLERELNQVKYALKISQDLCEEIRKSEQRLLEQLSSAESAHAIQRANYIELYEAVLGEGCATSDVKDITGIAMRQREQVEELKREEALMQVDIAELRAQNAELQRAFHNYPNVASHQKCLDVLDAMQREGQ